MAKTTFAIAKKDDGEVNITFTIPKEVLAENKKKVLGNFVKVTEVAGFRKGMAPASKVEEKIGKDRINEETLKEILPISFSEAIKEGGIVPAIYPKFSAVKMPDNGDWEIVGTTCELPNFSLGDYEKDVAGALRAKKIVVPGKTEDSKNASSDEIIFKTLLESVKFSVPTVMVDEEVNQRLSQLLARIEKLGLNLENYLASVGKNPQGLREEYKIQSENSIRLELILNKIVEEKKIEPTKEEVDNFIKSTGSESEKVDESSRNMLKRVLARRTALENLAKLV